MPKNDEGDFELVLGNKQLLSVFFIVVVLLGVFFTMGYIVGRNSSPDALTEMAAAGQPLVVEPGSSGGLTATEQPASGGETAPAAAPPKARPKPPAAAPPKARPKPVEPPKRAPVAKPKPSPPPKATPPPPRTSGGAQPSTGQTFLQVVATSRSEGETVRDVLQGKGFTVRLAPVPGQQDLFRVLVGPVEGAGALSKTRAGLQAAGFKPFTRRY